MAFLIILLVLPLIIGVAPWLGADSRNLERRPGELPDWLDRHSSDRRHPVGRTR